MKTKTQKHSQETIDSLKKTVERLENKLAVHIGEERKDRIHRGTQLAFVRVMGYVTSTLAGAFGLDDGGDFEPWALFQKSLFNNKALFSDPEFVDGFRILTMLIDRLYALWNMDSEDMERLRDRAFGPSDPEKEVGKLFYYRYTQSVPLILLGAREGQEEEKDYDTDSAYKGILKLRAAFNALPPEAFEDSGDHAEVSYLLDTVLFCQRQVIAYKPTK